MSPELRADIHYIVEEEMRRPCPTGTRIDSCCARLEELFDRARKVSLADVASEKMLADYRRLITILPTPERLAA